MKKNRYVPRGRRQPDSVDPSDLSFFQLIKSVYPYHFETLAAGLAGETAVPLTGLLHGCPPAGGSIATDFLLWSVQLEEEFGILVADAIDRGLFLDAGHSPSVAAFEAIRASVGPGLSVDIDGRLDFWCALYGDRNAATRVYETHLDAFGLIPAFCRGLRLHTKTVTEKRPFIYRPGVTIDIFVRSVRNANFGIETLHANAAAVMTWAAERGREDGRAREDLDAEAADNRALDATEDAAEWRADQRSPLERVNAKGRDVIRERALAAREAKAATGVVESAFEIWKKCRSVGIDPPDNITVAAATEVIVAAEHEEDRQILCDVKDVEQATAFLERAVEVEKMEAQVAADAAVAAMLKAEGERDRAPATPHHEDTFVLNTDTTAPTKIVLGPIGGRGNSRGAGDNDLLRLFEGVAGKALRLSVVEDLADLREGLLSEFGYAWEIVDTLLRDARNGAVARLRPTLLVGSPGSGKTSLLRCVGMMLGMPVTVYPCASVADGSFGGTPSQWSTRRPSVPLEAIRQSECANPCIILDEIEKTGQSDRNGSLMNAILPMLEAHTARSYFETGLEMNVDLSSVGFLATANSLSGIPAPLLDRFRVLQMPNPGPEHVGALVTRIVEDIIIDRGLDRAWTPALAYDEIAVVRKAWGGGSLRRLRRAVETTLDAREAFLRGRPM